MGHRTTNAIAGVSSLCLSIKTGEADDESSMLVTILALGQREIKAGDYRDINDFLAEMDEEDHTVDTANGVARDAESLT